MFQSATRGMFLSMEKAGPNGVLGQRAQKMHLFFCPGFWTLMTMRWFLGSWRADMVGQATTDLAWVGMSEGAEGTKIREKAIVDSLVYENLSTKKRLQ